MSTKDTTNASLIWDILIEKIPNPYGVAGLIGNLFAESSLDPCCVTGGGKGLDGADYAEKVMSGKISGEEFAHDGIAFGLAQWRYWSRKEQLYLYAREYINDYKHGIGDVVVQTLFLLKEIQTYKTVWNTLLNAKSVKEASDIVLLRYEKPANVSEKAKQKREAFGQIYYDLFAGSSPAENEDVEPKETNAYIRTSVNGVNLRCGNGRKFATVTQIPQAGTEFPLVASVCGDPNKNETWHAVTATVNHNPRVCWICGDFCEVITK